MKKIVLIVLCFISFVEVWCQSPEPWFYEGKQWAKLSISESPYREWTTTSVLQESAEIDGMTYWKVFESNKEDLSNLTFSGHYLREADRKVYWYNPYTKEEDLYMDFNLKQGDTLVQMNFKDMKMWVIAVGDTILPKGDGISRKYMKIGFVGSDHVWDVWVEGIGSLTFGIEQLCIGCTGGGHGFLCCHDTEKTLYMDEYYNTCFREIRPLELAINGRKWAVCSKSTSYPSDETTTTYTLNGAKHIGSRTYKEVWYSMNKDLSDMESDGYGICEENGKIYMYNERLKQEYLWFDFNLKVGDKFSFYVEPAAHLDATATVVAVTDTILPNGDGVKRKCIYLSPAYSGIMVEGIGSLSVGIKELMLGTTGKGGSKLLCCHESDDLIYQSEDGTCYKSTGLVENESDNSSLLVQCTGRGILSFSWVNTSVFNLLCLYTEDGTLYKRMMISSGEHQLSVYGVPQGTYIYVLTTLDNKQSSGKVYVK